MTLTSGLSRLESVHRDFLYGSGFPILHIIVLIRNYGYSGGVRASCLWSCNRSTKTFRPSGNSSASNSDIAVLVLLL